MTLPLKEDCFPSLLEAGDIAVGNRNALAAGSAECIALPAALAAASAAASAADLVA